MMWFLFSVSDRGRKCTRNYRVPRFVVTKTKNQRKTIPINCIKMNCRSNWRTAPWREPPTTRKRITYLESSELFEWNTLFYLRSIYRLTKKSYSLWMSVLEGVEFQNWFFFLKIAQVSVPRLSYTAESIYMMQFLCHKIQVYVLPLSRWLVFVIS